MAIDAVQQLHGLANMVHVSGHTHEREAGRSKERLCVLNASEHFLEDTETRTKKM